MIKEEGKGWRKGRLETSSVRGNHQNQKKRRLPEGCGVNVSDARRFDELDFHVQ